MSKRNVETLSSFFNRCGDTVEGFDSLRVEVRGIETVLCGQILCRRGDLYLMAECDDEVIETFWLAFEPDNEGEVLDLEIARWLLKRARWASASAEAARKDFEWSRAAMLTICGGDCPPEVKQSAAAQEVFDRDRAFEAEEIAEAEAQRLGEYLSTCAWGQSGNAFIGRRVSWDGHERTRLCVQGRVVAEATTDRYGYGRIGVKVFTEAEAEAEFQANRAARREAEVKYARRLNEARCLVRKWKRGENAEFTFYPGQMGGRIEFEFEGFHTAVSANGAGIEAGFDVECPAHPMSADALRQWEHEQEHEAAIQRAGLWRGPAAGGRKVRIAGEWFGCERVLTVGDVLSDLGRVQAVALPR